MNRASTSVVTSKQQQADKAEAFSNPGRRVTQPGDNSFLKEKGPDLSSSQGGFDLTQVPAHPGLSTTRQVQCCGKDGSPCSCPTCSEASKNNRDGIEEEEQPSAQASEQDPSQEASPASPAAAVAQSASQEASPASPAAAVAQSPSQEASPASPAAAVAQSPSQEEPPSSPAAAVEPGVLIVDDSATQLSEGQMTKTAFLEKLGSEIRSTIEPVLASKGQTTEGCPYLNYWLNLYQHKGAADVERTIRKYAPGSVNAKTAEEYILMVTQRALRAAEVWATTGKLSEIPEGVPTDLPGVAPSKVGNGIRAKAKDGGVKRADDPQHIQNELGEGQPLATDIRSRMEPVFGTSFSRVRTHTDSTAIGLSNRVNARAFTVGNHVAFGNDEYKPGTLIGDALIAHELAHVVQQQGSEGSVDNAQSNGTGYDALENDADQSMVSVMSRLWTKSKETTTDPRPRRWSGLSLQRCSSSSSSPSAGSSGGSAAKPTLTFATRSGPTGTPCGGFNWQIGWVINNATSSTNGVIVQNVLLDRTVNDCSNTAVPYNGGGLNPSWYPLWEAWFVNGGVVTPAVGNVNDIYGSNAVGASTKGTVAVRGTAEYFDGATLPSAFTVKNAPPAWSLPATNTAPPAIAGGTGPVNHSITATWDCCATPGSVTSLVPSTPP